MPNSKIFCNIPWFEIHIGNDGSYNLCGGMEVLSTRKEDGEKWNIKNYSIHEYWNNTRLCGERLNKLSDTPNPACLPCTHQDSIGNHSKRIKENLKSVIFYDKNFLKSYNQSPHKEFFDYSQANNGLTITEPLSYHIELGNECNLACIMCGPYSSSKMAQEYKKLNWAIHDTRLNWTDDEEVWTKFLNDILNTKNLLSFHIIGGEPTVNPRFYELIDFFVENNKTDFSLSFTTNATRDLSEWWDKLKKFKRVEIGISLETVSRSNDYVRYGSDINVLLKNTLNYKTQAPKNTNFVIRTVPTLLTILEYHNLIEWCYTNKFLITSYFATRPRWQQIKLLPQRIKQELQIKLTETLSKLNELHSSEVRELTNFKSQDDVISNLVSETKSAISSLDSESDEDLCYMAAEKFSQLDRFRNNSVFEYFPQLKDFFETYGYNS